MGRIFSCVRSPCTEIMHRACCFLETCGNSLQVFLPPQVFKLLRDAQNEHSLWDCRIRDLGLPDVFPTDSLYRDENQFVSIVLSHGRFCGKLPRAVDVCSLSGRLLYRRWPYHESPDSVGAHRVASIRTAFLFEAGSGFSRRTCAPRNLQACSF